MSTGSLEMGGKLYISSSRAATLVGYTKDYVGQLARAGKIDAKLIGRSWYIGEESIKEHKSSVHYTLKNPKKPRRNVSRVTEKTSKYTVKSSPLPVTDILKTFDDESFKGQDNDSETVPLSITSTPLTHIQDGNISHDSSAKKVKHNLGTEVLAGSDIEYEHGEALYYEDDRPVLPEPIRAARYENIPITKPTRSVPQAARDQKHEIVKETHLPRKRPVVAEGVSVDGVRIQRSPTKRAVRREVHERNTTNLDVYAQEQEYVAQNTRKVSSRAVPVLGAFGFFLLFVIWYIFSR